MVGGEVRNEIIPTTCLPSGDQSLEDFAFHAFCVFFDVDSGQPHITQAALEFAHMRRCHVFIQCFLGCPLLI